VPAPHDDSRIGLPPPASTRIWLYRLLAAVGLPVLFLVCLEAGLQLAGWRAMRVS
jgi:hypothetical protein